MNPTITCPRCGATHPSRIAEGLCPHCLLAGLLDEDLRPRPGEREGDAVGPYELVEHLADGGMGSVWRARQLHPVEREVALKIIKLGMDTREIVSRFEAERQSLAMMDHPAIARVYEAGATAEGRPYFAMELVNGETVTGYCVSRSLPVEQRLRLFMEICAAVEHAHRKGVLHRDLKPSNVMVVEAAEGPQVKVIDFGIAKLLDTENDGRTFATRVGHAVGTPGYMSPEQAGAEPDVDTRSDVYSLGALLYEMLTGRPPLGKETFREVAYAEVMRLIRETDPPRPSTRTGPATAVGSTPQPRIARDLDRIVMKALARERERRYGGAATLAADLRRFLDHEPVTATDPTLAYRAGKFVRKHRLAVAFCAALVIALAVSSLLVARETAQARTAAAGERAARLDALSTLADSYRDAGLVKALDQQHAAAALWFTLAAETATHDERRRTANRLRARLHADQAPVPVRFLKLPQRHSSEMRIDDGSRYLMESVRSRDPVIFDLETARPVTLGKDLATAAFIPGASLIAISTGDETVGIWDPGNRRQLDFFTVPGEEVTALWPNDDGSLLLAGGSSPRIRNLGTDSFVSPPLVHPHPVRMAVFSRDSRQVITIDTENDLRIFPVDPERAEPLFDPIHIADDAGRTGDPFLRSLWEKSGRLLVKIGNEMREIDATTGEILGSNHKVSLGYDADLSGDGAWVATPAGVRSYNGGESRFQSKAGPLRFLPDESGFFAADTGELLDMRGSRTGVTPPGPGNQEVFSPDGTLLALREATGIRVHRLVHPEPFLRIAAPYAGAIALSSDQRLVASAGGQRMEIETTTTRAFRLEDGLPAGPPIDTGFEILSAGFSSGTAHLLTGGRETPYDRQVASGAGTGRGVLQVWDVRSANRIAGPLTIPSEPLVIRPHPSEPWLAVLCRDGSILKVDPRLADFSILHPPQAANPQASDRDTAGLVFSTDGGTLHANGPNWRTWSADVASGKLKFPAIQQGGPGLLLQARGGVIFSPTRGIDDPWLIDARSGEVLPIKTTLDRPFLPYDSELSPDGSELLLAGANRIAVLDWRRGTERGPALDTGANRSGLSRFVPGTSWILSAVGPGQKPQSLRLWDSLTGIELSPRWRLRGDRDFTDMVVTADGRHAIVSIFKQGFVVVKLDELRELAATAPDLPAADRLTLAALQAGLRLDNGRPIPFAAPFEWATQWEAFEKYHPLRSPLKPARETLLRWHRNQEAFYDPDSTPGKWHRARLVALEAE